MMKRASVHHGRRHPARAKSSPDVREAKTVLTFEKRAQVYCWSTDRGVRPVIKH